MGTLSGSDRQKGTEYPRRRRIARRAPTSEEHADLAAEFRTEGRVSDGQVGAQSPPEVTREIRFHALGSRRTPRATAPNLVLCIHPQSYGLAFPQRFRRSGIAQACRIRVHLSCVALRSAMMRRDISYFRSTFYR